MKTFRSQINNSIRANLSIRYVSNLFNVAINYIIGISFFVEIMIGISSIDNKARIGEYAMMFVFMLQVNDYFVFFLKQMSMLESGMISF